MVQAWTKLFFLCKISTWKWGINLHFRPFSLLCFSGWFCFVQVCSAYLFFFLFLLTLWCIFFLKQRGSASVIGVMNRASNKERHTDMRGGRLWQMLQTGWRRIEGGRWQKIGGKLLLSRHVSCESSFKGCTWSAWDSRAQCVCVVWPVWGHWGWEEGGGGLLGAGSPVDSTGALSCL